LIPRHGFPPIPLRTQHCTQRLALAASSGRADLLAQALVCHTGRIQPTQSDVAVSRPRPCTSARNSMWDEDPSSCSCCTSCRLDASPRVQVAIGETAQPRHGAALSNRMRLLMRARRMRPRLRHRRQRSRHSRTRGNRSQTSGTHPRQHHVVDQIGYSRPSMPGATT
jgi:hypothetical protein